MPDQQRTVLATTDDLRSILVLIHSTLAYGASAVALTLVGGWAFVGIKDDLDVPTVLPLLAIASTLLSASMASKQRAGPRRAANASARRASWA